MNLLFHAHPSTAYFGRIISLINEPSNLYILNGPSLQQKLNQKFQKYLKRYVLPKLPFTIPLIESTSYVYVPMCSPSYIVSTLRYLWKTPESIRYASRDSMMRSKYTFRIYTRSPVFIRSLLENGYLIYALIMISRLRCLLCKYKIDKIFLSHANYIPYICLITASQMEKKTAVVVHGAFEVAYEITKLKDIYCFPSFYPYIYKLFVSKFSNTIYSKQNNIKLFDSPASVGNNKLLTYKRPTVESPADTLIIAAHCLKDNNYVSRSDLMLFSTYYDWLLYTVNFISSSRDCKYERIILKYHPQTQKFGEIKLLDRLFAALAKTPDGPEVIKCMPWEKVEDVFTSQVSTISPVVVTFHGKVASDMGSLGIPVIACGYAQGPDSSQCIITNLHRYNLLLLSPLYATSMIETKPHSDIIAQSSIEYLYWYSTLKPYGELNDTLRSLKRYFDFGENVQVPDKTFFNLLKICAAENEVIQIPQDSDDKFLIQNKRACMLDSE